MNKIQTILRSEANEYVPNSSLFCQLAPPWRCPSFCNPVLTVGRKQPLQWGLFYLNGNFNCMDTTPMGSWQWTVFLLHQIDMFIQVSSNAQPLCDNDYTIIYFRISRWISLYIFLSLTCSTWPQAFSAPGDQHFLIFMWFWGLWHTSLPNV